MKKKIVFFNVYDFGEYKMRKKVREKLIQEGWEVYVITPIGRHKERFRYEGSIPVYLISEKPHSLNPIILMRSGIEIYDKLKKIRPHVVCTFAIRPILMAPIVAKLLNVPCIINVITGLGEIFLNPKYRILKQYLEKHIKLIDKINSFFIFQNHDNYYYFVRKNLMIRNYRRKSFAIIKGMGVDLKIYNPENKKIKNELRYKHDIRQDSIVFLFVGRLIKSKGIEEFIEAFNTLRRKYNEEISAIVIGSYDKRYSEVKNFIKTRGVKWIEFTDNMPEYLALSDVAVLPSYGEGMSVFLQEALAAGLPVITTTAFGNKEIVENGKNGFLIPIKSPVDLAEKMEFFISNKSAINTMGKMSRLKAEREFDGDLIAERYLEIFTDCVNKN